MKEIFYGSLVQSYEHFLLQQTLENVMVIKEDDHFKEVITGIELPLITSDCSGFGICNLMNIKNHKKALQMVADYIIMHSNLEEFQDTIGSYLIKNKSLNKSYK